MEPHSEILERVPYLKYKLSPYLRLDPSLSPKIADVSECLAAIDKRITLQLNWVAFIITPLHKVHTQQVTEG